MSAYNKISTRHHAWPRRQRGGALLVSMIMVVLVLLLAVVGMRTITLESRITANMLENQRMYEAADGTLREGERLLLTHGVSVAKCEDGASSPVKGNIPCYLSEARTDTMALDTNFSTLSAEAKGFDKRHARWYPRYIATQCPKGDSATSALDAGTTGCTEFYEVNSQATESDKSKDCGPDALCLRSAVNMFVK